MASHYCYVASTACSLHCTLSLNRAGRRSYAYHFFSTYLVLYTTAENSNARSWVIETVGKSRKNAFQFNKNFSFFSFTTKSRLLILRPNLPLYKG